jgi:hypothetical protein
MKTYTDYSHQHAVYAPDSIPRRNNPLATASSLPTRLYVKRYFDIVLRHDLDFWVIDVQRPADLNTRVVKQRHEQPPSDVPQYGFPKHVRIHIRIRSETLLHPHQPIMSDELTAWYAALKAFPTRNLHSLSLCYDITGPKTEFIDRWPGKVYCVWDFSLYRTG